MNVGGSSTSATLMWVAEHASKVNATKRERMAEADARAEQVEELGLLKQKLENAQTPDELAKAKQAITDFVNEQKASGVENVADLERALNLVLEGLDKVQPPDEEPKRENFAGDSADVDYAAKKAEWDANKKKWDDHVGKKTSALDDLAQQIGQSDQIEIMRITTLDQSENRFYELGSNKIANDGKTTNALIGNIRV